MKPGDEYVGRFVVQLLRCGALLDAAVLHHRDPVPHRHRLGLVVRDVQGGDPELVLQGVDLGAHLHPELGVQVGQRFVHQERLRLPDDSPAHGDPLPLAAGQVLGFAVQQGGQREPVGGLPTRLRISSLGIRIIFRAKPMFCPTVMCGYSA